MFTPVVNPLRKKASKDCGCGNEQIVKMVPCVSKNRAKLCKRDRGTIFPSALHHPHLSELGLCVPGSPLLVLHFFHGGQGVFTPHDGPPPEGRLRCPPAFTLVGEAVDINRAVVILGCTNFGGQNPILVIHLQRGLFTAVGSAGYRLGFFAVCPHLVS